jgi:protein SCO1/2
MNKTFSSALVYGILIAGFLIYLVLNDPIKLQRGILMPRPESVPSFELMDNNGNLFTERNLKGHWSLLFFGFTSCTSVCPLTMKTVSQSYEYLTPSKRPQVILVSVDPERDSLQRLNQFVHGFNPKFIGLKGDLARVHALQKALHVRVSSTPMSHGAEILLINPEAKVQAYFYYPIPVKALVGDLERLIS